jgi:hypothetical protein
MGLVFTSAAGDLTSRQSGSANQKVEVEGFLVEWEYSLVVELCVDSFNHQQAIVKSV